MRAFDIADVPKELARWLPAGTTLAFPDQGDTSNIAFTEPGNVVFKRCCNPLYLDWLRRERKVLDALADTNLPVPRVLDYLDVGSEVWLVMNKFPGIQCAKVLREADATARLELLQVMGAALRHLHDTPVPEALRSEGDWLDRQLSAAQANLEWCDGTPELLERLRATRPKPVPPTLVHGDLNLENVLILAGTVTGFVDWAGGDIGDPRYDVALALRSDGALEIDDEMLSAFLAAYGKGSGEVERTWFEALYEFF